MGGQRHIPAALPLEKSGTNCIGGWVALVSNVSLPTGFEPRTVQPVASRSNNKYAVLPTKEFVIRFDINILKADYYLKYVY